MVLLDKRQPLEARDAVHMLYRWETGRGQGRKGMFGSQTFEFLAVSLCIYRQKKGVNPAQVNSLELVGRGVVDQGSSETAVFAQPSESQALQVLPSRGTGMSGSERIYVSVSETFQVDG